ncbi:hypothetical protein LTR94_023836 [Friedmanniomyces endolithicus]|nr:hypothetical protein LTR94_023836 [Friedmanniomyces endolithicus]
MVRAGASNPRRRHRLGKALSALAVSFIVAPSARAQDADWARAGGDLFFAEPATIEGDPLSNGSPNRLADLAPPFAQSIAEAAERHNIDPKLLHALVAVESAFQPRAVSPAGAVGLTQLMPGTAADLGVTDRMDPVQNLMGGADYLAQQLLRFSDLRLALAAYNSGPGRVQALGRAPKIAETERYIEAVLACYLALAAGRDVRSARAC